MSEPIMFVARKLVGNKQDTSSGETDSTRLKLTSKEEKCAFGAIEIKLVPVCLVCGVCKQFDV